MKKLRGVIVPIVTPFTATEEIDEEAFRQNVDWLIEEGVHGIVAAGSTGGFQKLSESERKRVYDITMDQVNGRVSVLFHTAADSTKETIRRTKYAKDAGVDAVLIVHPYYCGPHEEELYGHYKMVAEAVDIPIMIYNNPWATGVTMTPELLARLAKLDNISYVKESTGNIGQIHNMIRLCGESVTVFSGYDDIVFEAYAVGAQGTVAATANVIPRMEVELFELAVEKQDMLAAKKLFYRILPFSSIVEHMSREYVVVIKEAMNMLGKAGGTLRRPSLPLPQEEREKLRKALKETGLLS